LTQLVFDIQLSLTLNPIQAEQVFFVNNVKKPGWCSVVRMLPRNLFSMPEEAGAEKEGEIDVDSLVVGMNDMSVIHNASEVSNWTRADMPGVSVAASVIEKAIAQSMAEPNDADLPLEDQDEDDTYIDDGSVAPVHYLGQGADDDFFV
jgi:hypothetical protein